MRVSDETSQQIVVARLASAIAYAYAFAVATALEFQATLVTGDPGIRPLVSEQNLNVQWLPQPR